MAVQLEHYKELLLRYLRPQWRRSALLGALLLAGIALQLLNPQILRGFIDTAKAGGSLGTLALLAVAYLVIALATQGIAIAETYLAENVGWIATNQLRADLALHCLRLDMSFHNDHTPGELIERIDGDVYRLSNFFARFIVRVLGNALLFVGIMVMLFRVHWIVGVAILVFALVCALALNAMRDLAVPYWNVARQASADLFGFLEERLAGTEDIRSSGATGYVMRSSYALARDLLRKERKAGLLGGLTGSTTMFLFALGTVVSLAVGGYLYRAGEITIGTVFLIFNYTQILEQPLEEITRQIQDFQQAAASVARIRQLQSIAPSIEDGSGAELSPGALGVEFERVSFAYDEESVLRDVSFRLEPGRVLGIIGRTGSGKTTITRLIFRLYDPNEGAVRLGGADLRDLGLSDLRERVGIVTQDIQLFHAPVRDNLTLFDQGIPDERILGVLRELGLWGWYESLESGLDTKLAPGGSGLSAGEAQLLAFARVFLRDPGLIILDEASSRLDPSTERLVERAVDSLLAGRTAIVIAHRLATVQRADEIMVMERGRVAEHGRREVLAADPDSHFARMLRTGMEEALA